MASPNRNQRCLKKLMSTKFLSNRAKMVEMNEALIVGAVRQHEMTESAEKLNAQLLAEMAEHKQAEERLRISEIRYRRLFEVTQDGILFLDPGTGKITEANPYIFKLTGYTSKQIIGKELWEMRLFKDKETVGHALHELKAKGFCHREDLPIITKGGQFRAVDFVSNLYQEDGVEIIQCNLRDITRRKKTEKNLSEKARLLDLTNDAIIVCDLEDRVSLWNRGAEGLYGWTFEEAIGQELNKLLQTEFPNKKPMEEIVAHLYREKFYSSQVIQVTRDGRRIHCHCRWSLDKNSKSLLTSYTDISEHVKAEKALRTSEEFNRSIIQSSPDCIKILDLEGNLLSLQNGQDLLGIEDIGPYLNKSWLEFWKGDDRLAAQTALKTAAAGGDGNFVGFFATPKGQPKWWNVAISPILDGTEQPIRLLAVSREVTERKKVEDALRESEERYRNLFNSIDEGFCVIEMIFDEQEKPVDFRYLEVNPAFERHTGLPDPVGLRISEIAPGFESHWFETYGRVALTGEPVRFTNEAKALSRWFDSYAFPIGGQGSRKVAMLFRNITERMVSEEILRYAQAQLKSRSVHLEQAVIERTSELSATNKQLEAFVYSIAHDLRAPLRSMQGFSNMLMDDASTTLSEEGRDFATRINQSAQFMDALLQDLLGFSRIAQAKIRLTPINLEDVIRAVISRLEDEIRKTTGLVEMDGSWPDVLAHESTLGQVLINLISNALKFVRPGVPPHIRLRAEEIGLFVRIWVEDNGVGIEQCHQEQIFGLFTRLHGTKFAGTGIGLAIVQKGVERMGGKVGLESIPNQGSRFWFELRKG